MSTALLAGVLAGCAWKGEGLVETGSLGSTLNVSTGQHWKLVYGAEHRALSHLDGQIVVIEGRRMLNNLSVTSFRIPSGIHGMPVWYGTLEQRGVQLGLTDRNNGGFYLLGRESWEGLRDHVGAEVLVEGYVDGPHRIKVLYHQILD